MCDNNVAALMGHSHSGRAAPGEQVCPKGGVHEHPSLNPRSTIRFLRVPYYAMECTACGLQGGCTE